MSAESPRKPIRQGGHIVAPQPVSDRSIIESVAGFINDVVPQGYTSSPLCENKEQITWARFEYADINDPALYPDTTDDRNGTAPLLLVLGYGSGVQVWAIPASGEATEVLSWRQGVVRTLRVLPTPTAAVPDSFAHKRPLVALCDSSSPGPQFCSLSFISLKAGDQVKSIKFKNPVNYVLANGRSVVVSFSERIAVFDASTLEDRLTITTCYPCPGPNPNPVALGQRWLAYAERRLIPSKRCSGGTEGEGIQSYTATVLHAAKSLGKGLRGLGETVASSLTGGSTPPGARAVGLTAPGQTDVTEVLQPGIVTIVDAQGTWKENGRMEDNVIAHFTAHAEAVVALQFDPSGILLVTADKRGHDFHLFRIQPHPGGSSLAAVHHLYVLHRGDTTAKVQDIAFASDSRWVSVSTLRGTTHVFPVTPYGGAVGLRTHSTPHVVNRLSRFHRSAGLTGDGRNSPQPGTAQQQQPAVPGETQSVPYPNPRLPPYPHPTVVQPLAQIRQPVMHLSTPTSPNPANAYHRNPSARGLARNQSASEDSGGIPLRVSACFAPSRAWLVGSPTVQRDSSNRSLKRAVDSLFVMACHGNLIEYDLETKHAAGIPKEKVCDDTPIELDVQAKAQWLLLRPLQSSEVQPPLSGMNPLMVHPSPLPPYHPPATGDISDERWLSHVEIITHAGPHRRLWMGPQFTFKTYTASATGGTSAVPETEGIDIGSGARLARSNPVNMPVSSAARPVVPFLIESGSGGSYEQSPRLLELYGGSVGGDSDGSAGPGETQLREELADAMMESPGVPTRDTGRRVIVELQGGRRSQTVPIEKIVNPVGTVVTVFTDDFSADGKTIDGESMEAAVRWPSDVVKIIPKPVEIQPVKKGGKLSNVSVSYTKLEEEQSNKPVKLVSGADVLKCKDTLSSKNLLVEPTATVNKIQERELVQEEDESCTKVLIGRKSRKSVEKSAAAGVNEDIPKKSKTTGVSKSKEMITTKTADIKKGEMDVCTNIAVEEKERKRKDSLKDNTKEKCRDKESDKDASKITETVAEKTRNQKKRKPVVLEVMEDVCENIQAKVSSSRSSRSSSKCSDANSSEELSKPTKSSTLLSTSEYQPIYSKDENVVLLEMEASDLIGPTITPRDARARSSSNSSESYDLEDKSKIKVKGSELKLLETDVVYDLKNDGEESNQKENKFVIFHQSKSGDDFQEKSELEEAIIESETTSVQSKEDESSGNPWKNSSSFQKMVELPSKKSPQWKVSTDINIVEKSKEGSVAIKSSKAQCDESAIAPVTIGNCPEQPTALSNADIADVEATPETALPDMAKPAVDFDLNEGMSKVAPVPVQKRKAKGKNVASKVNSDVVLGSPPKSEKLVKLSVKVSKEAVEEAENVVVEDSSVVGPVEVSEKNSPEDPIELNAERAQSPEIVDEKVESNRTSPAKDVGHRQDDHMSTDIGTAKNKTENVLLKTSSVRKPKKNEPLTKVKKSMETESCASQAFEEPSSTICSVESMDTGERNETAAVNLDSRKCRVVDVEDVKETSAIELQNRSASKRVSKTKFKPFDMPVNSVTTVDVVDIKHVAEKSDLDDFPDLQTGKHGDSQCSSEDGDIKETLKPNVWARKTSALNMKESASIGKHGKDFSAQDEEPKKVIMIEDIEEKSSLSNLSKIRLSPPKLWSSIASTKSKPEKPQSEPEVLLTPTVKTWSSISKPIDPVVAVNQVGATLLEESSEHESSNGVDDVVTTHKSSSEQFPEIETVVSNNDSDIPTLLQANKKNNKKKNKKRR